MKLFKIEKPSLKNWLKFILIAVSVAVTVVLFGTVVLRFLPENSSVQITTEPSPNPPPNVQIADVPTTPVTETSPEPSEKVQEFPTPNLSSQIEPSPRLLQGLPEPAKLTQPANQIPQNSEVDREEQKLIASKTAYGHFLYPQGHINRMVIIASYGTRQYQRFEYLHPEAAKALMKMIYTARDEGVWLVPVSGFRTVEKQQELFEAQIQRRGSTEAAAKVSAPPGYSEHHTGFAIDLTDGNFPKKDITVDFENTRAYQWLRSHAQEFGFELSFPPNNSQGVSYEPWHWRYVGSQEAAAIFSRAN
ncbi:MAG: M15 family metallopeptidase [Cyanobacteriota bacterium]|nr:M15 family metallopeptidase [Cyanobacteriota bacterium]